MGRTWATRDQSTRISERLSHTFNSRLKKTIQVKLFCTEGIPSRALEKLTETPTRGRSRHGTCSLDGPASQKRYPLTVFPTWSSPHVGWCRTINALWDAASAKRSGW
jgi:hypothetical protein